MVWLVIGLLIVISLLLLKIYVRLGAIWVQSDHLNSHLNSGITDLAERLGAIRVQLDHLNSHLNSGITDLGERLERTSRPGGGTI